MANKQTVFFHIDCSWADRTLGRFTTVNELQGQFACKHHARVNFVYAVYTAIFPNANLLWFVNVVSSSVCLCCFIVAV